MSEPFIGEIRLFGFNYAPHGWEQCEGQLLKVSEYSALFSLLGTMYGGDGRTTFGLPDLRGRVAINQGQGPGLPDYDQGGSGGTPQVVLSEAQMPQHAHALVNAEATLNCSSKDAAGTSPVDSSIAVSPRGEPARFNSETPDAAMKAGSVAITGHTDDSGGNHAHQNMPPYLVLNYCIALQGVYPSRN